jgi:hypothetical protein
MVCRLLADTNKTLFLLSVKIPRKISLLENGCKKKCYLLLLVIPAGLAFLPGVGNP